MGDATSGPVVRRTRGRFAPDEVNGRAIPIERCGFAPEGRTTGSVQERTEGDKRPV